MFTSAFSLRQAFDRSILDCSCFNNMGFINPETVAVSLVAIHFAVEGCTTKGVPSSTHDKFLRCINKIWRATSLFSPTSAKHIGQ
jgi:hypothetical protein